MHKILTSVVMLLGTAFCMPQAAHASGRCSDYAVGESRLFTLETGVGSNYTVRRTDRSTYTIFVNPVFDSHSFETRQNIDSCLERVNAAGLGDDRIKIELKIFDSRIDRVSQPARQFITVTEHLKREDDHNYSRDTQCFVYVHELLHLAGLVDEYPEGTIGIQQSPVPFYNRYFGGNFDDDGVAHGAKSAYNCRAQSSSIMGTWNQLISIKEKEYDTSRSSVTCGCPKSFSTNECTAQMNGYVERAHLSPQNGCPQGWDEAVGTIMKGLIWPAGKRASGYRSLALLNSYAPRLAPLRPAHIRRLLWPTCAEKNRIYEACTANAYETSVLHAGKGCLKEPVQCRVPDAWQN